MGRRRKSTAANPTPGLGAFGVAALISVAVAVVPDRTLGSVRVVPGRHTVVVPIRSEMVRIPAGFFWMGSGAKGLSVALALCRAGGGRPRYGIFPGCRPQLFSDETPRRKMYLKPYRIDRNEVSRREYLWCVRAGYCRLPPDPPAVGKFRDPNAPVVLVSWNDARSYCRFRRKRLPTEAEWEKAARGPFGRIWPWGSGWRKKVCNHGGWHPVFRTFDGDKRDGSFWVAPVGTYFASRSFYGVEDMAGNVAEWVADRYSRRPYGPTTVRVNPRGPAAGRHRVVKGGSWYGPRFLTRAASRLSYPPTRRHSFIGFRCAR